MSTSQVNGHIICSGRGAGCSFIAFFLQGMTEHYCLSPPHLSPFHICTILLHCIRPGSAPQFIVFCGHCLYHFLTLFTRDFLRNASRGIYRHIHFTVNPRGWTLNAPWGLYIIKGDVQRSGARNVFLEKYWSVDKENGRVFSWLVKSLKCLDAMTTTVWAA